MREKMTEKEWNEKGIALFGKDHMTWRFKCPACGNVTTPEDFREYKDKGATPDSAIQECIGRYAGCDMSRKRPKPCDWAAYGLFRGPNFVIRADGKETPVFPFAETGDA